ncbi:DsrE family protein [Burkholderia sp. Ac-20353]|uniref:DsrE/DsrF/TusD sulfur relay family protein n=1 Tax=Burkholderia sp. Ac-20353 TaxID=2703894 RepID=UPI00197BB215|nr:DsrE family protein [Burkholderia sp. Ac-20353]MBN3790188.1 FeS-binding protein [Burkholderia sp. Ac-20353]
MATGKKLTLALMDPPYEKAASTTALRLVDAALRQGHDVTVFAYEGAVNLTMKAQAPHANPVKGTSVEEEDHPTTRDWIAALFQLAAQQGVKLDWINCGLCVDERGAGDWIDGPRRGSPKDFLESVTQSDAVLVIPTK